jgi:hypothetical protein
MVSAQHEQLGEELHGAVGSDAGHRDEELEGRLQVLVRADDRERLSREQLHPARAMAEVDLDVVAHDGRRFGRGRQRMQAIVLARALHDQGRDAAGDPADLQHVRRRRLPRDERHADGILAQGEGGATNGTQTVDAQADATSLDTHGFALNWTTNDATIALTVDAGHS